MGQAFSTNFPNAPNSTNNDFSLTRTFGFDVCKMICKNKHIKYQDAVTFPQDNVVDNLTVWAVFYPAFGSVDLTAADETPSFYSLNIQTYAEYEDA